MSDLACFVDVHELGIYFYSKQLGGALKATASSYRSAVRTKEEEAPFALASDLSRPVSSWVLLPRALLNRC